MDKRIVQSLEKWRDTDGQKAYGKKWLLRQYKWNHKEMPLFCPLERIVKNKKYLLDKEKAEQLDFSCTVENCLRVP